MNPHLLMAQSSTRMFHRDLPRTATHNPERWNRLFRSDTAQHAGDRIVEPAGRNRCGQIPGKERAIAGKIARRVRETACTGSDVYLSLRMERSRERRNELRPSRPHGMAVPHYEGTISSEIKEVIPCAATLSSVIRGARLAVVFGGLANQPFKTDLDNTLHYLKPDVLVSPESTRMRVSG